MEDCFVGGEEVRERGKGAMFLLHFLEADLHGGILGLEGRNHGGIGRDSGVEVLGYCAGQDREDSVFFGVWRNRRGRNISIVGNLRGKGRVERGSKKVLGWFGCRRRVVVVGVEFVLIRILIRIGSLLRMILPVVCCIWRLYRSRWTCCGSLISLLIY